MRGNSFRRRRRTPSLFSPRILFPLVALTLVLAAGYTYLRDLTAPQLEVQPAGEFISPTRPLIVAAVDGGSGLRSLKVVALQGGKESLLGERSYPPGHGEVREEFSLEKSGFTDGAVELRIEARDQAWFPFGRGNRAERTVRATLDRRAPTVTVVSSSEVLATGGAAIIAYRLDEEAAVSGVESGKTFFKGYRQPSGVHLCMVAFPPHANPAEFKPKLLARDAAGNERRVAVPLRIRPRTFPDARIPVSDTFLKNKEEEFRQFDNQTEDLLELFLTVNRKIRAENRARVTSLAEQSSAQPLFGEPFLRMPRAKTTGAYAEARDYYYNDRHIDHQVHLGTDLASVAQAPILAANPGKVLFSGYLGIYGGCVIIDHGLGVQTLYGHMSATEATVGENVARGQQIGRSGNTGMSGGDHLHFEVLVSGVPVNPIEWMDRSWLETFIFPTLRSAR